MGSIISEDKGMTHDTHKPAKSLKRTYFGCLFDAKEDKTRTTKYDEGHASATRHKCTGCSPRRGKSESLQETQDDWIYN